MTYNHENWGNLERKDSWHITSTTIIYYLYHLPLRITSQYDCHPELAVLRDLNVFSVNSHLLSPPIPPPPSMLATFPIFA